MCLTILGWTQIARAQSCATLLDAQFTYLDRHGPETVQVTLVTQQTGSWRNRPPLASYTSGFLRATGPLLHCNAEGTACSFGRWLQTQQGGRQLFNDRTRSITSGGRSYTQEFDALAPDNLGIFIGSAGEAYVQLNSWGGGTLSVTGLQCANDVMYGFDRNGVLYAFAFSLWDPLG